MDKGWRERNALPLDGGMSASGQEAKRAAVQGLFCVENPWGIFLES